MSSKLSGARLQDETAFMKRYLDQISEHPVNYGNDFVTPPEKRPRKMPMISLELSDPAPVAQVTNSEAGPSSELISIVVKSLKPALSFPVKIALTDSVIQLKQNVGESTDSAPSPEFQRLLLKGKALADSKLLKEYGLTDGSVINMVLKPGWDAVIRTGEELGGDPTPVGVQIPTEPAPAPNAVPSLTISDADPAAEGTTSTAAFPARPLTSLDLVDGAHEPHPSNTSAEFHNTIADPEFWKKVHGLCRSEFLTDSEADGCWHAFLGGLRAKLSPGEIAKIQDSVGVTGMGGSPI